MDTNFKSRIPWREKLERDHSKIVEVPERMARRVGHGMMLIPRPLDVDALMRTVKKGKLIRSIEIRKRLARDKGVNVVCPLTTGIFIRIAAEAAEEDRLSGKKRITPYWRVVREDGTLQKKFPGGEQAQARRLREEGHEIERTRGSLRVKGFEKRLTNL